MKKIFNSFKTESSLRDEWQRVVAILSRDYVEYRLWLKRLLPILLLTVCIHSPVTLSGWAQAFEPQQARPGLSSDISFEKGVLYYRQGFYDKAAAIFSTLHRQSPESVNTTYYLAISQAQLGKYDKARQLYLEIMTLEPNSKAGQLAEKGITYLPSQSLQLDQPPQFARVTPQPNRAYQTTQANQTTLNTRPGQQPNGTRQLSPQDLVTMQMMMQSGGNSFNGAQGGGNGMGMNNMGTNGLGMNPMMMNYLMGQQGQSQPGQGSFGQPGQSIDPNVFSSMMMNQMMQNFDMTGGSNNRR
ncbi:MAG: tetratricopeptide repeat protein [Vampirovibrio sp.]|nr:tetratricopeptide repeat protein [Vampirovibrio sp.]